ncbi:type II secretion system F family protein [Mangrovibacillus cuniculi]|uniref:Type II secretion system protein GspF domain-containing protein n=1 Tax=Mangrovibacillus cuniculi TaxID=2593652 RepID=A0A7S8CBD3_9BACI|nr:type II secretion system F family protein [Mangrovibacillus cuniculi]QPC46860.1 hypothetical protein G8O30_07745 [Mangrovibacillus cuniculi]
MKNNKISIKQPEFFRLFSSLRETGYTELEAVQYMETLYPSWDWLLEVKNGLKEGIALSSILKSCGFSKDVCWQVYCAETHGHMKEALTMIYHSLIEKNLYMKQMKNTLKYPILLLLFFQCLLYGMKVFIHPFFHLLQPESSSSVVQPLLETVLFIIPIFLWCLLLLPILIILVLLKVNRVSNPLPYLSSLEKFPMINYFLTPLLEHQLTREWSFFIRSGFTHIEWLSVLEHQSLHPVLRVYSIRLSRKLKHGYTLGQSVSDLPFISDNLVKVVESGEKSGTIGRDLSTYSKDQLYRLQERIQSSLKWIQPMFFTLIAICIILLYLSLILPLLAMMQQI